MKWSWSMGRIAGIDLRIHATFLLLVAYVAFIGYQAGRTALAALNGVLFILLLFASVVAHELGHALTARRFGVGTRDITLLPIGGVAQLERMPREPRQEMLIALAGPAVTLLIVAVLWVVVNVFDIRVAGPPIIGRASLVVSLYYTNILVLLFNLLPAFPMDGGRVLRAGLAMRMDYVRATDIAARVGKAFALLFGLGGLLLWNAPLLVLIALFVWMGAAGEASAIQFRSALGGVSVERVMIRNVRTLAPTDSLGVAVDHVLSGFQQDFPVVDGGRVVGVLTRSSLVTALTQRGASAPVSEAMDSSFAAADPREPVEEAFSRLAECRCRSMPVVRNGELVGVLTSENIGEYVMVEAALASRSGNPRESREVIV